MDSKKRSEEKQNRSHNEEQQGGYKYISIKRSNSGNKYAYEGTGPTPQLLLEKDQTIQELRETIEVIRPINSQILELKIKKLEQLVKLKDAKIQILTSKLSQGGN